jgi:catechol 2,3-dioxygenase-like lactoylglutathione lyase family enzyme
MSRFLVALALALALLLGRLADSRAAGGSSGSAPAMAVGCIGVPVSDLERATAFYSGVLSFQREWEEEALGEPWERLTGVFALRTRTARMRLGDECLDLTEWVAARGRPVPLDSRSNDRWFQHVAIVVGDMDRAYQRLGQARVEHVSPAPQRLPDWNRAAGGIRAFYFLDPDRHVLEVIWFPPGKGDPRWQRPAGRADQVFLGIDHTAIAVSDTEASLRFWRDALGLSVAGNSLNYGPEQERLNAVFGARLRITGLRASRGPGIEFLEYLSPRDGRPYPADARPNDLWQWETAVSVRDADEAASRVRAGGGSLVSAAPVALPASRAGGSRALIARDPDGHALQLIQY